MPTLADICEPFLLLKHRRERQLAAKQDERDHVIDLMDTMLARVQAIVEKQAESTIAQAQATGKLAEPLAEWLTLLREANEAGAHQTTSTVRSIDEHDDERQRELERLTRKGLPVNSTSAEQLAWLVENDEL